MKNNRTSLTPTPALSETLATQPSVPPLISSTQTPATDTTEHDFLSEQLTAILQQAGGTFGVIVYDPANGQPVYTQNQRTVFSAASLIKLPIAMTIYEQAAQGMLQLDDILTLHNEDIVGGTGSLQYEPPGTTYTIRQLTTRMIAESDNTAANMLINRAGGFPSINQHMQQLGATDTILQRMLMDLEAIQAGRDNLTTPSDMLVLLQLLEEESIEGAQEILQAMVQTTNRQKIPALLPPTATTYHKIGTLSGVEHDIGIVESPEGKRFILIFMSSGLPTNQTGITAIAEASRLVYDTMTQPQASSESDTHTATIHSTPTYTFPVRAAWVEYTPYHHDYPAADIFCPVGSEFLATTSGVVDFVNRVDRWEPATDSPADRGGIMLAIVGDDGWRYYASHLLGIAEGIEPGVRVTTGQLLGWTGRSGNARYTDPHVHYGISHPTNPEDWQTRRGEIPPYEYLQAWERGEHKTPGE